jgi:hypothetical protein
MQIVRSGLGAFSLAFSYSSNTFNFPTKCTWKVEFTLEQATKPRGGIEVYLYSLLNLGARWGWVINTTAQALYPRERPVPIV